MSDLLPDAPPPPDVSEWRGSPRQWAVFALGATLLAVGVAVSIAAGRFVPVGVGSWQVLETGLVATTGARFAVVVIVESFVALALAWLVFRVPPGAATVVVAFLIGPLVDFMLGVLPSPTTVVPAVAQFAVGTVLLGIGVGLYVSAKLGPSAQDALFVGMFTRLPLRPAAARFLLDAALTVGGWLLGGQLGAGTVVVLLVLPPIVERSLLAGQRLAGTEIVDEDASRSEEAVA